MTRNREAAIDRMTMSERPNDLHVDMTGLDDGEEPLEPKPEHAEQLAALDDIGELR